MEKRVAVVTGANRGIGLEICRQLAQREDVEVILTARHAARGQAAVAGLQEQGHRVQFQQLDVTDQTSVRRMAKFVADQFGRADILVNNAGVYPDEGLLVTELDLALVRQTFETNFYGPLRLCQLLLPLMARNNYGRVVNLTSGMSLLRNMRGRALAYRASKAALNTLTRVLAAEARHDNILINSADPGWVRTAMGGEHAPRSLAEGADTAVWLATLPAGGPTGGFFRDRQRVPW